MNPQLWSWILTAIGLTGFYLAAHKVWWCWYINIANQLIWAAYSLVTQQWGFLIGVVAYTIVFSRNAGVWTREHREKQRTQEHPVLDGWLSTDHDFIDRRRIIAYQWIDSRGQAITLDPSEITIVMKEPQ